MTTGLARQLELPIGVEVEREAEFGGDAKVLSGKVSKTSKASPLAADDPRVVTQVIDALRDSGQLHVYRPERAEDFYRGGYTSYFVHENVVATPVYVPLRNRPVGRLDDDLEAEDPDIQSLTVWVSDPLDLREPRQDDYDFAGSFLFLVEELLDFTPLPYGFSGISALRMIVDFMVGGQPLTPETMDAARETVDRFGRWHPEHPIEKLESIGGIAGQARSIETVYRVAYVTND